MRKMDRDKLWDRVRRAVTFIFFGGFLLALSMGRPETCRETETGSGVVSLCRGPELSDPIVVFGLLFGVILLGWTITEISVGGTKILIGTTPANPPESHPRLLDPVRPAQIASNVDLKLLVAGAARLFPSEDAYLMVLYRLKAGSLLTIEFATSRSTVEDVRTGGISDSITVKRFGTRIVEEGCAMWEWLTPFPDVNSLVRRCVGVPVPYLDGDRGAIVAIPLLDGKDQASVSDIAILSHLQAASDAIDRVSRLRRNGSAPEGVAP